MHSVGTFTLGYVGLVALLLLLSGAVLTRRLDPAYPLTAGLCLSVFSGHWDQFGIPAAGPDRLLLAIGLGGTAWQAWRERGRGRLPLRWVHVALAVLAAYAIGSAVWAGTITDSESVFALLDKFGFVPFALFVFAPVAFETRAQRDVLLAGLTILGAYLGITAVFEATGLHSLVQPAFINNPGVGLHYGRARGPFLEAAANGLALYACLVASGIAFATWRRRPARAAAAGVATICIVGIVATLTRQIWLGAAVATLVPMIAFQQLRRYLLPAAGAATFLVLFALVAIPGLATNASDRAGSQRPVWDRLNSDRAALNMVEARPLLGFGWGRFPAEADPYYQLSGNYPLTTVGRVHNVLLSYAVELGLVGLVLWLAVWGMAVGPALVRRPPPGLEPWRMGMVAYILCWLVVSNFTPLGYALPNYLLWLLPGIVSTPALARARAPRAERVRGERRPQVVPAT